ncbi:MAG: 50S ribosomal protein L10 [Chlamydiia bacterium]|nr:50S ribosomal protein L10 [Chlamydiia bacterium]
MRKEKQYLLDEVENQISDSGSFVMISYSGLSANAVNGFRSSIRKKNGGVEFVKKRLLVKAAENLGFKLKLNDLPGHIGIVLAKQDPIEITKEVFNFHKDNKKNVEVVGGRIDGALVDGEQMKTLSQLPGKDEMRAQLLATLEAPLSQTLATMEALVTSVIYCLDNKAKQGEKN